MQSHAGLGKCALPCSLSELFFVLQLRLPIPSVRILTFEFCGTIVRLTSPPLSLIFFVPWLVTGRDGQVHHEGAKESAQETDPIDQDPLRRFSRVLRIFAENRSKRNEITKCSCRYLVSVGLVWGRFFLNLEPSFQTEL